MTVESNGNGATITAPKIAWWLMMLFAGIVIMAGGAWMSSVNATLDSRGLQLEAIKINQALLSHRLTSVETQLDSLVSTTRDTAIDVRAMRRLMEDRTEARAQPPQKYPLK